MSTEITMTAEVDGQTGAVLWTAEAKTHGVITHEASAATVDGALWSLAGNLYATMVGVRQHDAAEALADARESALDTLTPTEVEALERSRARIRAREAAQLAAEASGEFSGN